ncbi:hypothetical protein ACTWQF_24340 [Streptomyces sp. 8N114]|uniref:hypothetical protein n=1 Tax=Streptomyces sp. 8N114 TaxID=3457419 RepID=UPI003FD4911F
MSELKFDKLDTAITKWKGIKDEFDKIATGKGEGADVVRLEKQATSAHWTGEAANTGKPFVVKVAREFHDAADEAKSIHQAIKLARQRMHKHQSDLHKVVEDLRADGLLVASDGTITDSMCYADEAKQKASDKKVKAAKVQIEKILRAAAATQHNLADGLRQLVKNAHDFSGANWDSYEDIQRVTGGADAKKAADLIKKLSKEAADDDDITMTNLDALNDLAEIQRNNPGFAEGLAKQLSPKETLEFWRMMPGDGLEVKADSAKGKELSRLRDNLGMTLATASREKSPEMMKWKQDLINLGNKPIGRPGEDLPNGPFGFQVMGSLMGKGKFDTDFLRDYEKELRTFDKGIGQKGRVWPIMMYQNTDLDPAHQGERSADPMTGFLKAVSHNPEFATDLFKDKEAADYYLNDREFVPEDSLSPNRAAEALGDALYAGGSGLNPDDPDAKYAEHTGPQNEAFHNIFDRLAAKKDDLMPELRGDVAHLLGNHGTEVHATMSAPLGEGPLDEAKLLELSKQVSQTPEGYAILNESMNRAIVNDIVTETKDPSDAITRSGRTMGFLEEARHQAIADQSADEQKKAGWKSFGTYAGAATALRLIPPIAPVAGHLDLTAFALSRAYTEDEQARIAADGTLKNIEASKARTNQLTELAKLWQEQHGDWADPPGTANDREGYVTDYGVKDQFGRAADHGKDEAERIAGR